MQKKWKKFWPSDVHLTPETVFHNTNFLTYNKDTFRILKLLQSAVPISISDDKTNITSTLQMLSLPIDSIALDRGYAVTASVNAFTRIQQYRQAVRKKQTWQLHSTALGQKQTPASG